MLGGAFDPPHNAHVALARTAVQHLRLDALHVLPTGRALHRPRPLSDGAHRLAMARLAFGQVPSVRVDDRELRRDGPSFTVDTLTELRAEYPGAQLYLVIGEDQAAMFRHWHRYEDILRIAIISVAGRQHLAQASTPTGLQNFPGGRLELLPYTPMDVSSTDIRQRVASHLGIDHLVPDGVARYIEQHHLYLHPR